MPEVAALFRRSYGRRPVFIARAPGRVNLIGEHIDYNGLSVLPMAIQRAVRLAVEPRPDGVVRVRNARADYGERSFRLAPNIEPYPTGDWGNYLKAASQALVREHGFARGLDAVVESDLPVAAGLSSSSALVVATGLALAEVNEIEIDREPLGALMARAERYVGTMGGGMDQAVSLGAVEGHACRVDFDPLRLTPVPVPPDWRFVVASSLVPAEKSGAAQRAYNRRTAECRQALEAVGSTLGFSGDPSYRGLMESTSTPALLNAAEAALPATLLRRFRHVITESHRVREAEHALRTGDLTTMGALMDASHASLRDDYEVSSAELDRLVEIARVAGAAGARLTGAGFGGCIVALTDATAVDEVMRELGARFFEPRGRGAGGGDHLFAAEASAGASLTRI